MYFVTNKKKFYETHQKQQVTNNLILPFLIQTVQLFEEDTIFHSLITQIIKPRQQQWRIKINPLVTSFTLDA